MFDYMKLTNRSLFVAVFPFFLLFIQACSIKQFGENLSNNFDYPQESNVKSSIDENLDNSEKNLENKKSIERKSKDLSKNIDLNSGQVFENKKFKRKSSSNKFKVADFKPLPYRVIIKLSGANPAAPAETVTKALRQAGIKFEVEKIERFDIKSDTKVFPVNR